MTNLLDNAAKWSPPLGTVSVRLDHGVLRVADQGHGIAEDDLPHVFDRFYRSAESRTMPGSGLGLVDRAADRRAARRVGARRQRRARGRGGLLAVAARDSGPRRRRAARRAHAQDTAPASS